jgi:hypothetical protein
MNLLTRCPLQAWAEVPDTAYKESTGKRFLAGTTLHVPQAAETDSRTAAGRAGPRNSQRLFPLDSWIPYSRPTSRLVESVEALGILGAPHGPGQVISWNTNPPPLRGVFRSPPCRAL